jgi:hypothetical protein
MSERKRAAIDLEKIAEKELDQISASEFLSALNAGGLSVRDLTVWPEKKKVELWVEPENFNRIRVRDVIITIRNEKKKVELEKQPGTERWPEKRLGREGWPESWHERELTFEDLVDRVARNVEARLRSRSSF